MPQGELTIRRLSATYQVARDHPCPERVRWRLDQVAKGPLCEALEHAVEPLATESHDEVILIQRLEIDVDLDPSRDASQLAARWAKRFVAALAAKLAAEGTGVVRFPNARSYVARFVVDIARENAWGKWYYLEFRRLSALPAPAIIRTAVLDDVETGLGALRILSPEELRLVLRALGEREARRIVETVGAGAAESGGERVVDAFVAAAEQWRGMAPASPSSWITALGLLICASGRIEAPSWPAAARLVAAVALGSSELTIADDPEPSQPDADHERASQAQMAQQASGPARVSAALAPYSTAQRKRLAQALTKCPAAAAAEASAPLYTPFGGLLLLLPHIASLPLAETWPLESDRAFARLLILAKCAGGDRAMQVLSDPVIGALAGVEVATTPRDCATWIETNRPRLGEALAGRIAAHAAPEAGRLTLTVGRVAGQTVLVVAKAPEGFWHFIVAFSREGRRALRNGRNDASAVAQIHRPVIELRATLTAAHTVSAALRYLRLPDRLSAAFEADLALSVAAQRVLRGFARRLPGFADSSPAYLYKNFLDFEAAVELGGARLPCRVTRPPLAALLGLTGMLRGSVAIPWQPGVRIELLARG